MNRRRHPHGEHTDWCARDHRCGHDGHRSPSMVVDLPGHARAVLTRIRTGDGHDQAEIRVRVALADADPAARRQLAVLLADLDDLITRAGRARYPRPRHHRPAA
ncbi:hypothetical protein O7543_29430 [Solwaraspora sp. WMMA2080]|uniref:hypothetical protein n=1 Tax=unclassified Solwaraspora TaxID=2627926 RepID=UPI00248BB434|nr:MULTISPECIES: hypothetical protein [unclassified Solwaraspora]WBB95278.1 hypothetical protein O7553_17930 [Solwaraspora sp. WMMA2059]WBC20817.1 hypothetical protein O7543_29430 [Solwaraspora sp. WMMA2080]